MPGVLIEVRRQYTQADEVALMEATQRAKRRSHEHRRSARKISGPTERFANDS